MSLGQLRNKVPHEFFLEFMNTKAAKLLDREVIRECDGCEIRWVGNHKHVYLWWVIEGGYAVGWNENPSRGWSFPVVKMKD